MCFYCTIHQKVVKLTIKHLQFIYCHIYTHYWDTEQGSCDWGHSLTPHWQQTHWLKGPMCSYMTQLLVEAVTIDSPSLCFSTLALSAELHSSNATEFVNTPTKICLCWFFILWNLKQSVLQNYDYCSFYHFGSFSWHRAFLIFLWDSTEGFNNLQPSQPSQPCSHVQTNWEAGWAVYIPACQPAQQHQIPSLDPLTSHIQGNNQSHMGPNTLHCGRTMFHFHANTGDTSAGFI